MTNDFSIETLQIVTPPSVQRRRQKRGEQFVLISRRQLAALRKGDASASAWNVFIELLWLSWKGGGKSVKFTNRDLADLGISRNTKTRALEELEELGLIRLSQQPRRSPLVTMCTGERVLVRG
jgi:CRP-like cAMP-binding protein